MKTAAELKDVPFPDCYEECEIVRILGVGECDSICPHKKNQCPCGSGKESWWENDAQGIPLERVCPDCKEQKLSKYRSIILTGYTQADVDEPIEPEE